MSASKTISNRKAQSGRPASAGSSSSTVERFNLRGPTLVLDPATNAYRRDVADIALAGQLFAPHYARPVSRYAVEETSLNDAPADGAGSVATLRAGAKFALLDSSGGWAWGYECEGHLVGYVREAALTSDAPP